MPWPPLDGHLHLCKPSGPAHWRMPAPAAPRLQVGRSDRDFLERALAGTLRSDLLAVDRNVMGSFDTDANLVAVDLDHRDDDVVTDHDFLTQLPAQNQHGSLPVVVKTSSESLKIRFTQDTIFLWSTSCAGCLTGRGNTIPKPSRLFVFGVSFDVPMRPLFRTGMSTPPLFVMLAL